MAHVELQQLYRSFGPVTALIPATRPGPRLLQLTPA